MKFYDIDGNEIDGGQWIDLFRDNDYRQVAYWQYEGCWVSTVWLGCDYGCIPSSTTPVIFETMFYCNHLLNDQAIERYSTLNKALEGHKVWIEVAKEIHSAIEDEDQ